MKPITCIIVDDEEPVRRRLECLLRNFQEVELLSSLGEPGKAVEEISRRNPDIVFLDVEMPGMSGFDLIEQVRLNDRYPTFVFVTAFSQYAIKAIKMAAFDFMLKPVAIDEIFETLQRYRQNILVTKIPVRDQPRYSVLSSREKEILELLIEGKSSRQIAGALFISRNTVDTHRRAILKKLGAKTTVELMAQR